MRVRFLVIVQRLSQNPDGLPHPLLLFSDTGAGFFEGLAMDFPGQLVPLDQRDFVFGQAVRS
jgi:hypothetical protein